MKKRTVITLFLAVFLLALPPFVSAEDMARLAGPDRYRTAIRVSETGWEYADTVVLARGDHWADAIAGAPLARQLDAPILLTHRNYLSSEVATELARLRTRRVVVLGGPEAVSIAVSEELNGLGLIVDRICGEDRYDTAAKIAQWVAPAGSKRAFLVSGEVYTDALSAASYAAADSLPILLTKRDTIPKATESALAALGAPTVLVVGGKSAISDQAIKGIDDTIRLGGKNRYETNISVTSYFRPYSSHYFLATGEDFPDALAVSVLAARRGMGLLLIGKELHPATANYIQENVAGFTLLGGTAAISQQTAFNIAKNLTPCTGAIAGWTEPGALVRIGGRETIAGGDGYYGVSGLADGPHQVSFQKTGFATGITAVQISQGRTSSINWPLAELSKDGIVLEGCVIEQGGTPLADADIKLEVWDLAWRLWDRATEIRTGPGGMFSWSNVGKWFEFNQPIRLSVSKKGFQPIKTEYVVAGDTLLNTVPGLHLRRLATSSIFGTVTCNGEAVPGAAIDLSTADGDRVARGASGPSGEYRFSELPLSQGDYILLAEKPGLGKYVCRIEIQEGDRVICNPELKLGQRVCFYLAPEELLYEGSPAFFAQGDYSLRLLQNGLGIARKELVGVVGEVLRFDIPGLISPGLYTAVISGDYALTRSFEVSVGDADVSHYSRTPLAGAVSGKVVGPGGNALQGAVVRALSSGDETCIALTGPEGEFSFGGLLPGRRQFEIIFPRYKTLTTEILVLPNSTVCQDIMLDRISFRGTLSGYIRSAGSLLPIEGAEVTVNLQEPEVLPGMTDEATWEDIAFTDKAGNFRLANQPAGRYNITIKYPGVYETRALFAQVQPGENLDLGQIVLETGGKAELVVSIKDQAGMAHVKIIDPWGGVGETLSAEERIVFQNLSAGKYTLLISQKGYLPINQVVPIERNDQKALDIYMKAQTMYQASFRIFGAKNLPLPGAVIQITGHQGIASVISDENGSATTELTPGNYRVRVLAHGYYAEETTFILGDANYYVPVLQLSECKNTTWQLEE